MIDFEKLDYPFVTKEGILEYINEASIFGYYTGEEVCLSKRIISPLRKEKRPSFGYFIGNSGELCFNDFGLRGGDFVTFVQLLYNLDYYQALCKIAVDFNIDDKFIISSKVTRNPNPPKKELDYKVPYEENSLQIGIKSRPFNKRDIKYWLQFNIDYDILNRYDVVSIDYVFLNDIIVKSEDYAYAYRENKEDIVTYKIYQPFSNKYKWINNHNNTIWQGWTQLPDEGEIVIITSSLKDVMSIVNTTKYNSVSLQSESTSPKAQVIDELKNRFSRVVLLYDNDYDSIENKGQIFSDQLSQEFNLESVCIPSKYKCKDFSDLVKDRGTVESSKILTTLINNN